MAALSHKALNLNRNHNLTLAPVGLRLRVRLGLRLCLLLLAASMASTFAADTNSVLAAWFNSQTNLQTWSADFTQTRALKTLTQPLVTAGHLSFVVPNKFRWELGKPARTIALRAADEMFVIYPLLKRAERYPMGEKAPGEWRDMLSLLDAGFPRNRAEFDARFRVLSITETNGSWLLGMQPVSAFARKLIKEIRIGLATNDFSLTSNEMIFADGSSMRNDYTNGVLNPKLDAGLFTWQPEPGFKITEPMGK